MAYNPNYPQGQGYGGGYPDQQYPPPYPYPQQAGTFYPGQPPPPTGGVYPANVTYPAGGTGTGGYPQQPGGYPSQPYGQGQQYPQGPPPPTGFNYPPPQHEPKPDDVTYSMGQAGAGAMAGSFEFDDKKIRMAFVRKVFSILMIQLAITVGFIALFTFHEPMKVWTKSNPAFFIAVMVLTIVLLLALSCCESVRRKSPGNIICLMLFTVCEGFVLGAASSTYSADAVLLAAGITTVVCLALIAFSFQTKWDFTAHGGIMFVAVIVLFIFGILAAILRSRYPILHLIYASLGALIFSIYLVYDIQMMIGGKKHSISPEEYIFAALNVYLDVINIFIFILQIVGYSSND